MRLDPGLDERIRRLAREEPISAAEIHRLVTSGSDGQPAQSVTYAAALRAVRSERELNPRRSDAAEMAGRILSLLDRELRGLERNTGRVDLSRLDQLAATLRRLDPIRPKAKEERGSKLRSLLPTAEQGREGDRRSEGDLNGAERSSEI